MSRVSYADFYDNYLVKDGDLGNEENLTKSPIQLKNEVDEVSSIVDILIGNEIQVWAVDVTYRVSEYVYHDGLNYKCLVENIGFQPDISTTQWELVNLSTVGSGGVNLETNREEFVATEGQTDFETVSVVNNSLVYVEGLLVDESDYTASGRIISFNEPLVAGAVVVVLISAILPNDLLYSDAFTSVASQTVFTTTFEFSSAAVYVNGVLQGMDKYTLDIQTVTFNESLFEGDEVQIFASVPTSSITRFSRTEVDFTASAAQTEFFTDYTVGSINVLLNGVKLRDTSYTASNSTSVTIPSASDGDWVNIVKYY